MGEDANANLAALRLEEDILRIDSCYLALHHVVRAGMPTAVAEDYLNKIAGIVEDLPMRHPHMEQDIMEMLVHSMLQSGEEVVAVARRRWHHPVSYVYLKQKSNGQHISLEHRFTYFEQLQDRHVMDDVRRKGLDALNFLKEQTKPAYTEGVSLQAIIDSEAETAPIKKITEDISLKDPMDQTQYVPIVRDAPVVTTPVVNEEHKPVKKASYVSRGLGNLGRVAGMFALTGVLLFAPVYHSFGSDAHAIANYAKATYHSMRSKPKPFGDYALPSLVLAILSAAYATKLRKKDEDCINS